MNGDNLDAIKEVNPVSFGILIGTVQAMGREVRDAKAILWKIGLGVLLLLANAALQFMKR